jgi:KDO2-lipid IV(A) lauroyltransferase
MDEAEIDALMRSVWDNLGRLLGEWPHLGASYRAGFNGQVEIVGREIAERAIASGGPAIIITGHYGNWELTGAVCKHLGMPLKVVFRPAQNIWVNWLVKFARRHFTGGILPKGKDAAAGGLKHLRDGKFLGVLIDQKLNEGVAIPFFGREAMTSPLAARLAIRFRCPILPVRAERIEGIRYRVTFYPPLELPDTGDRNKDIESLMLTMNRMLEDWIRERPDQWFWVHKRWRD